MIEGRSILAVIPARGNSRGLPGKNTVLAGGKPVIAWSIEAAQASRYVDRVVLSSEDEKIMEVARQWDCEVPFARPSELATDEARIEDALLHALDALAETYDYLVLLQPTSPLRTSEDIDRCLEICQRTGAPACVSVSEPRRSPYWMYRVEDDGRMEPLFDDGPRIHRRQDLPKIQSLNGAVYVAETGWFRRHESFFGPETRAYVMPIERAIDLDGPTDLLLLHTLFADLEE